MADFERRLAPFYPVFIAFGILFFVVGMFSGSVVQRVMALVWLLLVPLWVFRYRVYRRGLARPPQNG